MCIFQAIIERQLFPSDLIRGGFSSCRTTENKSSTWIVFVESETEEDLTIRRNWALGFSY